jgi:hypothetical protein
MHPRMRTPSQTTSLAVNEYDGGETAELGTISSTTMLDLSFGRY